MQSFDLILEPDPDDPETAQVFVDGSLDGHPYRFLLDTGAARTAVARDDYTSTFAALGKTGSNAVFARTDEDLIQVPEIRVGPLVKTQLEVARLSADGPGRPSLIGMDFLKDRRFHFLFDARRVLVDPAPEAALLVQDLFLDEKSHPYVEVAFEDARATTVWDTGAGITVADRAFVETHPALFQEAGSSFGTDAAGHRQETPLFMMAASQIGGFAFAPHKVAEVDLSAANATLSVPMDLILGYTTLCQANWWFDFPGRRWAVTKRL